MIGIIDYDAGNIRSVEKSSLLSGRENSCFPGSGHTEKCGQSNSSGSGKLWAGNGKPSQI